MSDSLQTFTVKRGTDGTTFPTTLPTVPAGGPYQLNDTVDPNSSPTKKLYYEVLETTVNGVVVPYNVASIGSVPAGNLNWARYIQNNQSDNTLYMGANGLTCAIDSTGAFIIAGSWLTDDTHKVDFGDGLGPQSVPQLSDNRPTACFISKYNPNGSLLWSRRFGSGTATGYGEVILGIAVDSLDNIVVLGNLSGAMDCSNGTQSNCTVTIIQSGSGLSQGVFLAKFSLAGQCLWAFSPSSSPEPAIEQVFGESIDVDSNNNILVAIQQGNHAQPVLTWNNGKTTSLASISGYGLAIAKFSPGSAGVIGLCQWAKVYGAASGTSNEPDPFRVRVDASGHMVVSGDAHGSALNVGGGVGPAVGGPDTGSFVFKYSGADGTPLWTGSHIYAPSPSGSIYQATFHSLAIDPLSGRVYAGGGLQGSTDYGGGTVTAFDGGLNPGAILLAFDSSGNWVWNMLIGPGSGSGTNVATRIDSLAMDSSGELVMGGRWQAFMDLNWDGIEDAPGHDYFVAAVLLSQTPLPQHYPYFTYRWASRNSGSGTGTVPSVRIRGGFVAAGGNSTSGFNPGIRVPIVNGGATSFLLQYIK